jgi:competence protein ComEC
VRDTVRAALGEAAGRGLGGDRQTLVRGMALGGGGGLTDQVADDMRRAGIWHLLAVSGQNIAYVVLAIQWLVDALGLRRRPGTAVALGCVIVYLLACDGGASVWRAGIVGCLVLVGDLVDRERDRGYLMLVGLAVLLGMQPRGIADPGLQLSFAAVGGLLLLGPTLRTWMLGFFDSRGAEYVASSIAATLATAPITIANFGTMSLVGVAVNVLVSPLAGPVVIAALLGAVVGVASPSLGEVPTLVAGWGASLIADIAHAAATVPGASQSMAGPGIAVTIAVVVAIPVVRWWLWSSTAPSRIPRRAALVAAGIALAAVVQLAVAASRRSAPWPAVPTITVLDVGQGDAIVLRSPEGGAVLVDTGPDGAPARAVGQLAAVGVHRLSAVLVTHHQADHDGALGDVLASVPSASVYAPQAGAVAPSLHARLGRAVQPLAAGDQLRVGQWTLDVLWPPASLPKGDPNDGALVIRATCPNFAVLLGSDAEGVVLRRLPIGRVDVVKVSHHGSDDPDLAAVLTSARPSVGVISVGAGNSFGHPTSATLATLAQFGVDVRRTDRDGPVTVQMAGGRLRVTGGR